VRGFGLSLSNEEPVREVVALAREAERLGFDEVSLPESRLHNAVFSTAAAVLATTDHIRVRIGVTNPVTRHPVVLALEAATLAGLGGPERIVLGLSAAQWTNRALGLAPPGWRPYTNTVEALRALRSWLAGDALDFEPTTFAVAPDLRLDRPPAHPVQLDLGPVNARLMQAGGELADGVQLGAIVSPGYVRWAVEQLATGAARSGRTVDDLCVSSNVLVSVDADRPAAREAVREVLAYYLWRVEGVVVDTSGADPENVAAGRSAVAASGPQQAGRLLADQVIDTFAATGDADEVTERLRSWTEAGVQLPLAWHTLGPDRRTALRVLARDVAPALRSGG
jgi:5,10-methylenetetrahydromethanopterin reductase